MRFKLAQIRAFVAALIDSRDKEIDQATRAARRIVDFIGRVSALLALLFICYGFLLEGHRSQRTNEIAEQSRKTADQAKHLSEDNRRLAITAKALASRVDALNKESRQILLDSQRGRRRATIQGCARDRAEHKAMADLLNQFHVSVPPALGPVDCEKRLRNANLD